LGGWIETDGYPRKVGAAFLYREEQSSLLDPEVASQDPERSGGGQSLAGAREIVLDCCEDVLRLDRLGFMLAGGEK
jgi:hypothetical protein